MNEEICKTCLGSGREKWKKNYGAMSVRRGDGSRIGPHGWWVPARKSDAGSRTRACETCGGTGIDPAYTARQHRMKIFAEMARITEATRNEDKTTHNKPKCAECSSSAYLRTCTCCKKQFCQKHMDCYEDHCHKCDLMR